MNRTVKKMKLEGSSSSSSRKSTGYSMIHSGHYMTSCLHDNDDNDDDTVEMPIASPDATNNEVTMAAAAELEASSSKSASTTALSSSSSPSVATAVNVDSSSASGGANSAASSSVVGGGGGHGSSGDGVPMTPPSVSVASSPGPVMFKKSRLALFSSTNGHKSRSMMPKSAAGGGSEERTSSEGAGSGSGGVATVDDSSVRNIVGGPETVSAVELMNAVKNEQIALSRGQTAALILPGGDVNMQDAMANARKNLFVLLCAQQGSISGGLTLDKTNKSLMKLIFYIKTAYSNNLTSPKWKNFKGFKLQVTEKIRINNVIWRSWFEQFGFKDSSKRKRRLVCQFSIGMGDETTMSTANTSSSAAPASVAPPPTPKMSDRENKFWKARLESITNEYKKWRELSRKQIKATTMNADGTPATTTTSKPIAIPSKSSSSKNDSSVKSNSYQSDKSMMISQLATSSSTCLDESSSLFSSSATATTTASSLAAAAPSITVSAAAPSVTTLPSTASVFNSSAATTPVSAQIGLAAPMPAGNNMASGYYYGSQGFELNNASSSATCPPDQLAIQTTGSFQSYGQPSTSAASYSGNSYASSSNSLNPYAISAMAGGGPPINTNSPNFSSGMTNSVSTAPSHYHHSPIASKQMPYNNRCRSPSPGLFQDFDLYSFSSDTLFSTYLVEDTKDPVFGTNPDFFQPDLMHLYPNFDFFELCDNDFMSSATTSAAATAAKSENKSSSPVVASHHLQNYSSASQPTAAAAAAAANNQQQQQHYGRSQSSNFEQTTHIQNLNSTTSQSAPNSADTATSSAQQDARKYSLSSVDYSNNNGLSNFDTLVHVATAAQNVQNHKQQPSPDVLQYNNNRSLSSTSASNSNSNNTAAASSNNNSNSANTIRNLLAMNNTNNNSATNSNTSTAPTVSPKLPSSSMRSSMLSSKLQQHQHHQSNAIQTSSPSSKSTPTINGGLNQPPMLNNPVVSSLSQILEKSNTAATAAAMMMNNKSKSVALNEGGNSQTISSLLAALSSASSNISSANPVASSPSTSGDASIDNPSSGHKGKRGRKGLDPLKLSPSNSANSVVVAAASIKSKANYNSKKDMKYTLADPIDDNNLEVKQQQQQQMAVGNNNPYQTAPIYDLMNNNPSNNTNNYNSRHYNHGPQQHHHQNGGMNNTETVHSINSTPTNSPPSSQNNNYNPHGYMTLVAPPPPPPPPPPPQAYESDYMMAKNNAATSSSSSRHHLLASSSSSASSSPPNDTAATYSALNPIASGLNGVVAASGLSAAPPGSVLNRMNRSSSVTSVNTLTDANLSNAEQKRRCNIQHGFDRLQMLVPSLLDGKNAKVSKAVMLQKTSEYIKELQTARENRMGDLAGYKRELDELSDKIVECQSQLPANGVSVASGKLNRTERYEQKFNAYIKERTLDNWRFYIFSLILRPLFDSFLGTVTMSSKEDMQRTFEEWTAKSCNLTQLRPIASTALRQLVKSTSILTDSSRLPEECLAAVLAKI